MNIESCQTQFEHNDASRNCGEANSNAQLKFVDGFWTIFYDGEADVVLLSAKSQDDAESQFAELMLVTTSDTCDNGTVAERATKITESSHG